MNPHRILPLTAVVTQVEQTGPPDAFGDPTEVTTTASFKCWIWRGQAESTSTESTANENVQISQFQIALEAAAAGAVDGSDRVLVNGVTYEVVGPPWTVDNPRVGGISHVEAFIRRSA